MKNYAKRRPQSGGGRLLGYTLPGTISVRERLAGNVRKRRTDFRRHTLLCFSVFKIPYCSGKG